VTSTLSAQRFKVMGAIWATGARSSSIHQVDPHYLATMKIAHSGPNHRGYDGAVV
jgi:hypothetical protein